MKIRTGAWVIIHCKKDGSFLLARRSRRMRKPNMWNLFGGCVDSGESPREAAVRELHEESGILLARRDLVKIGKTKFPNSRGGSGARELHYYLLTTKRKPRPRLNREHSEFAWFDYRDLPNKTNRPTEIAIARGIFKESLKYAARF